MPILSNNARSIESLALTSTIEPVDQLIIQQATGDTYYTRRCSVSSLKTSLFTLVTITSGTIDNTSIGGTTPAAITGTTITATAGFTGNVTITGGTINSTTIGTGTAAAIKGTTITGTTITATTGFTGNVTGNITSTGTSSFSNVTITGASINGTSIGTDVPDTIRGSVITAITRFAGSLTGNVTGNVTSIGTSTFTTVDINGGTIDGTSIGGTTPVAITGTTITGTTITANTKFIGPFESTTATITGGTINNTSIGGTTPAAITGTTITATAGFTGPFESTTATITGGTINGTIIGGTAPVAVTGTTITANTKFIGPFESTTATITGGTINGTIIGGTAPVAVTGTTITGTTITATTGFTGNVTGNITSTGTSTFTTVDINGGAIDFTSIGSAGAVTITGTTITATTGFTGNVTGDILSATNVTVLDNGSGGVSTANFYGTSSNAKTSSYATKNGIPSGGSSGYVLTKNSGTSYDVVWGTGGGGGDTVTSPAVSSSIRNFLSNSVYNSTGFIDTSNSIPKRATQYTWGTSNIYDYSSPTIYTNFLADVIANKTLNVTNGITGSSIVCNTYQYLVGNKLYTSATIDDSVLSGNDEQHMRMSASIHQLTIHLRTGQNTNILIQTQSNSNGESVALKTIKGWSGSINGESPYTRIQWESDSSIPNTLLHNTLVEIRNIRGMFLGSYRKYKKN